jgi:hypothetical protein
MYNRESLALSGGIGSFLDQTIRHAMHGIAIIRHESHSSELQFLPLPILELALAFALSVRAEQLGVELYASPGSANEVWVKISQ